MTSIVRLVEKALVYALLSTACVSGLSTLKKQFYAMLSQKGRNLS